MYFTRPRHYALHTSRLVVSLFLGAACGGAESVGTSTDSAAGAGTSAAAPTGASQGAALAGSAAKPPVTSAGAAGAKPPVIAAMGGATAAGPASGTAGAAALGGSTGGAVAGGPSSSSGGKAGAGGEAAAGGIAPVPSAGGFPRLNDEINVKAKGPYKVALYTDGLVASEYASAVMYYPEDAAPPFAAVALSPGFTAYGTDYEFVGDMLASHGIAALLTTPTTTGDQPGQRGEDLVAAVKHIQEENTREGSPLKGKIATDRIGITGHSMGGGGSLFGANALGDMIRCVVPLQPWQPGGGFSRISAPTMIVGAASDAIASVGANAQGHYSSIPDTVEKFLIVLEGDHYLSTDRTSGIAASEMAVANEKYDPQAAYMIPFYKIFLEDDERYRPYLYGSERSMEQVTDYQKSKM